MEPCYRYRARLERVVDGDTIDVLIELGFYVTLRERVRLEGIDTPEIYRVPKDSEEYKKGMEAKEYVERRLNENGKNKRKTEKIGAVNILVLKSSLKNDNLIITPVVSA